MPSPDPSLPSDSPASGAARVALLLGELLPRIGEIRILEHKLEAAAPASLGLLPTEVRLVLDALELVRAADAAGRSSAELVGRGDHGGN